MCNTNYDIMVSIVTVCFNSAKTIRTTLEAMKNQTFKNIEYIIIDGNSTDDTLHIIEEYRKQMSFKVIVKSENDYGIYDAMNKGIQLASGQLVGIVNSDDWYENDAIENIVNAYTNTDYEVIYGMKRVIENESEKGIEFRNHNFLKERMICHPTCFVTKKIYDDFGMFDFRYKSSADYEFMLRIYESRKIKFVPVYKIITNFRTGGMSFSQIGYRETLLIRLKQGLISKKQYRLQMIKSIIGEFIKNK